MLTEQFMQAAQEMVMADYGDNLGSSSVYYPISVPKYKTRRGFEEEVPSQVPYFPADRLGIERNPSGSYRTSIYGQPIDA